MNKSSLYFSFHYLFKIKFHFKIKTVPIKFLLFSMLKFFLLNLHHLYIMQIKVHTISLMDSGKNL